MPSKSASQARLMAACAHGANYKKCPPKSVAKEFNQADAGRKVQSGPVFAGRTIQRVPTEHKPRTNIYKGR